MMRIVITAESTIDLPQELLDKFNIKTTPFGINFNEKLQMDKFGISKEIFEFVDKTKTLPKTSAIAPAQYKEFFEDLKKSYDAIIHISLSSLMSSAYSNAVTIANEMDNVFVVDSRSLSTGIALLAIYASGLVEKGKSASEIFQKVKEKIEKVRASFVIDKLNYLHKGGRCSALSLLGANILKIKPQIVVENGKMVVAKKYRGSLKGTVEKYCDDLLVDYPNPHLEYVFITRSSEMNDIVESLKDKLRAKGFRHIYDTMAGGTISSHCGPNCIGVLFMDKDEKDD
jgi:DegV family protein with EDD domain